MTDEELTVQLDGDTMQQRRKHGMELVINPEDVTLLTTIAENPDMPQAEFDKCVALLTADSKKIANAIRDISKGGLVRASNKYHLTAQGMLNWARQNRLAAKSRSIA